MKAGKASDTKQHLWGRIWAAFDILPAKKTKGHATAADIAKHRQT